MERYSADPINILVVKYKLINVYCNSQSGCLLISYLVDRSRSTFERVSRWFLSLLTISFLESLGKHEFL